MGRGRGACFAAVFAFYDVSKFLSRNFLCAYLKQCAHNGTYHVAQKSIGRNGKHPLMGRNLRPLGVGNGAVVGFYVGM